MPSQNQAVEQATALMIGFAERTGIAADVPTRRYLWTDAFAVCNFLALAQAADSSDVRARHAALALRLVDQVHAVLGRYRPDDGRKGWLGAGSEKEGESHPTRGGLRIGKPLPERGPDDPFDEVHEADLTEPLPGILAATERWAQWSDVRAALAAAAAAQIMRIMASRKWFPHFGSQDQRLPRRLVRAFARDCESCSTGVAFGGVFGANSAAAEPPRPSPRSR
jgi:hypothetical protein